jgi:hypothetical protein
VTGCTRYRSSARAPSLRALLLETRGAVTVEYLAVTLVGLMVAAGLLAMGVALVRYYAVSTQLVYGAHP